MGGAGGRICCAQLTWPAFLSCRVSDMPENEYHRLADQTMDDLADRLEVRLRAWCHCGTPLALEAATASLSAEMLPGHLPGHTQLLV